MSRGPQRPPLLVSSSRSYNFEKHVYLSICISVDPSFHFIYHPYLYPSASVCLSICISACLCIYPSTHLPIYGFHPSIHSSIQTAPHDGRESRHMQGASVVRRTMSSQPSTQADILSVCCFCLPPLCFHATSGLSWSLLARIQAGAATNATKLSAS